MHPGYQLILQVGTKKFFKQLPGQATSVEEEFASQPGYGLAIVSIALCQQIEQLVSVNEGQVQLKTKTPDAFSTQAEIMLAQS